ncbi:oligopeptide transporter OPT family [Thamnocephalis sphaerospora]|uniref:Oligopeptide transporter OPT family n=1 Tax=Thamnocephalis sphaerospora TaxID=78915 RepID=A0A4V1IXG3_9FUNG|nr:oligopeptide transporter OPT family [Thamnocephalis sphaerospora]|eukprot:RKP10959.1 oligopeptide transporter OPT family [Thamnocephalis sphaerospora]
MHEAHPADKAAAADLEKRLDFTPEEVERYNSPYEVVRVTVSTKDDPTLPTLTFRFWVLGIFFNCVLAFVNQFFWYRATPLTVTGLVAQLLSYPLGSAMARILPDKRVNLGLFSFSLNPGPFNVKEHVLITVCATAGASTAYAVDIVAIKRVFYGSDLGFGPSLLLILTTQCLGYGLAGMCRRFLVRPSAMIWPAQLVNVTLFRTLHEEEEGDKSHMSRIRFFVIVAGCSFAYYFLPGYLASFLSTISLLCYFAPRNRVANLIGSGNRGLGLLSFSLDWNYITGFLGTPLAVPLWAQANIFVGFLLILYVLIPIGYFSNIWDAQKYPIFDSDLYRENGDVYDTMAILDENLLLDETKYAAEGQLRLSYFFAITYGIGFAALSSVISHTILYHGKEIVQRFREARSSDDDIHARLMDRYPEVPDWWYIAMFVTNTIVAIIVCELFGIDLPWWGLLLAVAMSVFFIVPIGIITAVTNQMPGLNIITELVIGFILPGRAIANVTFKTYGYITMVQGLNLVSDLKLGHYMKIPPRHMFIAQTIGTMLAGLINLATSYLMFYLIPGICNENNKVWSCDSTRVFYSASVIWGAIGPNRMFGSEGYYSALNWWFLIGFLAPIPFWLLTRRFPNVKWLKYIHTPVLIGGTAIMPPAKAGMYTTWIIIGFISQFIVYRYRRELWSRFNYVLSAAMDSGVAIAGLIIFFAFQYWEFEVDWWGNQPDCPHFKEVAGPILAS